MFKQPACRKPAKFFKELRPEECRRIRKAHAGTADLSLMGDALRNDQFGFFRCPAFAQQHRARFLDPVDVRLGHEAAHLAVEIFQARNDDDRIRQPVGDLDEIANGTLKAFFRIVEEAQILDLVDAEHQRRAIDRPNKRAKRRDDFERAIFAGIRIKRANRFMRNRRQLAAVQILANALIDARIAALQIKQSAARC